MTETATAVRIARPNGTVRVDGDDLSIATDFIRGHFHSTPAREVRLPLAAITKVAVTDGAMGVEADGQWHAWHPQTRSQADALAAELAERGASVTTGEPPQEATWVDTPDKMSFLGSAKADAARTRDTGTSRAGVSGATAAPHAPEVKVITYKNAKEYEKDAQKRLSQGWTIQGQSEGHGRVKVGSTIGKAVVFAPWALMRPARKGDPLTVTWVR